MINIKLWQVAGWEPAIKGMRNPMNSWDRSDSGICPAEGQTDFGYCYVVERPFCPRRRPDGDGAQYCIGAKDYDLAMQLSKKEGPHSKYRRMIVIYADITAPLYWWKEFDTYKVGTVSNSCSTMHKIHDTPITEDVFSFDHVHLCDTGKAYLAELEKLRQKYVESGNKEYWYALIQLLPSSYNQLRTVMLNYEVLANIYRDRRKHKLDEWRSFCYWIEVLPYSTIITGETDGE